MECELHAVHHERYNRLLLRIGLRRLALRSAQLGVFQYVRLQWFGEPQRAVEHHVEELCRYSVLHELLDELVGLGNTLPDAGSLDDQRDGTKGTPSSNSSRNNTFGFYGQQEFALNDRLFITGAARVDNNSAFGSDVSWVTYPKGESLLGGKRRADRPTATCRRSSTIFVSARRMVPPDSSQASTPRCAHCRRSPVPNGVTVLTTGTYGNPNLKPERVVGKEFGFEAGLFRERLGIDLTYFNDVSHDAILSKGVAPSVGFGSSSMNINAGEITKHGIELGLRSHLIDVRRYGWDMNFNIATQDGQVKRLSGAPGRHERRPRQHGAPHRLRAVFMVLISRRQRVLQRDDAQSVRPEVRRREGRRDELFAGDNSLTNALIAPKVFLGRSIPRVTGSWTNTIRFGDFRLYGMFDFARGFRRTDNNLRIRCQLFLTCLEVVKTDNTDPARLVQMQTGGSLRNFVINDASYASLREVSLSYDAPNRFAGKLGAHSLGFTASARNMHWWTKYTGLDPENQLGGTGDLDQAEYPQLAALILTVRLAY
jgi:hypothetical protein